MIEKGSHKKCGGDKLKVLKNNHDSSKTILNESIKPKVFTIICDNCDSELEITKDDTYIGWLGAAYITCPCCGKETLVEEVEGITLTVDNLKFPNHFLRTNKNERNVKEVCSTEILKEVKNGIKYFRNNKDEFCWFTCYGDLFIVVFRYSGDEEYYVVITKDFYDTNIPFEKVDYE